VIVAVILVVVSDSSETEEGNLRSSSVNVGIAKSRAKRQLGTVGAVILGAAASAVILGAFATAGVAGVALTQDHHHHHQRQSDGHRINSISSGTYSM